MKQKIIIEIISSLLTLLFLSAILVPKNFIDNRNNGVFSTFIKPIGAWAVLMEILLASFLSIEKSLWRYSVFRSGISAKVN